MVDIEIDIFHSFFTCSSNLVSHQNIQSRAEISGVWRWRSTGQLSSPIKESHLKCTTSQPLNENLDTQFRKWLDELVERRLQEGQGRSLCNCRLRRRVAQRSPGHGLRFGRVWYCLEAPNLWNRRGCITLRIYHHDFKNPAQYLIGRINTRIALVLEAPYVIVWVNLMCKRLVVILYNKKSTILSLNFNWIGWITIVNPFLVTSWSYFL